MGPYVCVEYVHFSIFTSFTFANKTEFSKPIFKNKYTNIFYVLSRFSIYNNNDGFI